MATPSIPGRDRKAIRRRPGKQMVEGKSFRLADEIRYIQRRAADRHGRVVTFGQLVLLSTEPGDIEENDTSFVIDWKGNYRVEGPAFIYSDRQTRRVSTILGYPTHLLAPPSKNFKYLWLGFRRRSTPDRCHNR